MDLSAVREPFLRDPDVTLYCGDALEVLAEMPAGSVDCCVSSPPYWGLRDYGTGLWNGGAEDCDHTLPSRADAERATATSTLVGSKDTQGHLQEASYRDVCGKCGARRVDQQLGLEATPGEYVARMVDVFREIRRVLRPHGTCWLNLGDSYASSPPGNKATGWEKWQTSGLAGAKEGSRYLETLDASVGKRRSTIVDGLKPKDLVGIPWRVAFALQADGWYLRSDIVWSKPNPMPESVTDRPTKSHEYVFLLSKQPRYFFDQEAVREGYDEGWRGRLDGSPASSGRIGGPGGFKAKGPDGRRKTAVLGADGSIQHRDGERWPNLAGRNVRSVWEIATQPYPDAHFAVFPEELARRCILAGCPEWVCGTCGKPRERIVEMGETAYQRHRAATGETWRDLNERHREQGKALGGTGKNTPGTLNPADRTVLGWSDCGHGDYRPGVVLDPFIGSGTTALVARKHGRRSIGIDLNEDYLHMAAVRLQQLSLLAEGAA